MESNTNLSRDLGFDNNSLSGKRDLGGSYLSVNRPIIRTENNTNLSRNLVLDNINLLRPTYLIG
jgi:hypothetical protein